MTANRSALGLLCWLLAPGIAIFYLLAVPSFSLSQRQNKPDDDDEYPGFTVFRDRVRATFKGHTGAVHQVAFSPDGMIVASASGDATVRLWDVAQKKPPVILGPHPAAVGFIGFSPEGKFIAASTQDRRGDKTLFLVKIWHVSSGKELSTIILPIDGGGHVKFLRDGKTLVVSSAQLRDGNTIFGATLIDAETGKERGNFMGHSKYVTALALSPDGNLLATGSWDGTAKIWDLATRKELVSIDVELKAIYSLAFSPDGKSLATGSENLLLKFTTLKIWDVATGKETGNWQTPAKVPSVQFSPDGKTMAVAGGRFLQLWNLNGDQPIVLKGPGKRIQSLAYSPDGKTIATAEEDQCVRLWQVPGPK